MKIALVTHYYSTHRGGVETVAYRLAAMLAANPDVFVEWLASDCDPVPDRLPERLRCTPAAAWNGIERRTGLPCPLWMPGALRRLWRAIRESDVVHLHDVLYFGNLAAFVFARLLGKPVIVTQHVGELPHPNAPMAWLFATLNHTLVRWVLQASDKVVFISKAVEAYFASFCVFRTLPSYVPNGVDAALYEFADAGRAAQLRHEGGRPAERPICLFVGRFVDSKGIGLVLELARRLPHVDWILAGSGPGAPESARLPNVSVVRGKTGRDIAALYQMADLLVLPSQREGFPLVVQEAMACGTAALVSPQAAEGCPAAWPYLFSEALLPPEAAGPAWQRRIELLLADREGLRRRRDEISRAARALWSWPDAAQAYLAMFRALARPARPRLTSS